MGDIISNLQNGLIYSSIVLPFIYLIGFAKFGKAYKIFTIYLLVEGWIQFYSHILVSVYSETNIHLSHWYFISQFILLSLFYYQLLKFRWIFIVLGVLLVFFGYQYISDPDLYMMYNAIGMSVSYLILVFYAMLYFYKALSGKKEFVIVNVGIFFYLISSVLIFASGNLVFDVSISQEAVLLLYNINIFLFLIFQLLIVIEWWRNYRRTKIRQK